MAKRKRGLPALLVAPVLVILIGLVGSYIAAVMIYDASFNYRCSTPEDMKKDIADYPELSAERHTFKSDKGQTLVGYLYESIDESIEKKALVVFAHGLGGGGQNAYMELYDICAAMGYYVFAYDATANDESEGERIGGLPQGYIDLDHAIDYAKSIDGPGELPLVLAGYSWGAMSVANVLNYHPEAVAVVSFAGWNRSMDLIEHVGCGKVGELGKLLLPFAELYEHIKYGDYADSTAISGFAASDAAVMIVHGREDTTVPPRYGIDLYREAYQNDPRFTFVEYPDRDHSVIMGEDGEIDEELVRRALDFVAAAPRDRQ